MKNKLSGALLHFLSFVLVMVIFSIVSGTFFIDQKTTNPVIIYSPLFPLVAVLFKTVSLIQSGIFEAVVYSVLAYVGYYVVTYLLALVIDNATSRYFFTKISVFPRIKSLMKRIPYDQNIKNTKKDGSKIMTSNIDDIAITELTSILGFIMGEDGYIDLQNKLSELGFVIVSHHTYHNDQDGVYRIYKKESRTTFDVERGGDNPKYFIGDSLVDIAMSSSITNSGQKRFMFIDFKYLQNFSVNNDVRLFAEFFSDVVKKDLKTSQDFNEEDWGNRYQMKIPLL